MAANHPINQLMLANVAGSQAGKLVARLTSGGFYVTQIDSQGGILHDATVTLFVGFNKSQLARLLEHIRECCRTRRQFLPAHAEVPILNAQSVMIEAEIGGATVYVFNVQRFEQL
jgi:uncharacterized protein YaaQ